MPRDTSKAAQLKRTVESEIDILETTQHALDILDELWAELGPYGRTLMQDSKALSMLCNFYDFDDSE